MASNEEQIGVLRFVALQLDQILARHQAFMPPNLESDLRLLQQAIGELAPDAVVLHMTWPNGLRRAA